MALGPSSRQTLIDLVSGRVDYISLSLLAHSPNLVDESSNDWRRDRKLEGRPRDIEPPPPWMTQDLIRKKP